MVSFDVDTAAPADELDFPLAAIALVAALRMDASASELVVSVEDVPLLELVDVDADVEVEAEVEVVVVAFVVMNAIVDVLEPWIDPRSAAGAGAR